MYSCFGRMRNAQPQRAGWFAVFGRLVLFGFALGKPLDGCFVCEQALHVMAAAGALGVSIMKDGAGSNDITTF